MGRSVSTTTSNNVILTAFSNIAQNDAVAIGPKGLAYKVSASDTAAVSNITYGTAQTTAATGMIVAQTQITNQNYNTAYKRQQLVQLADKSVVVAGPNAASLQGLKLSRYSTGGALLGTVVIDSTANVPYCPRVFLLSNGSICVIYEQGTGGNINFAIVDQSLNIVKALTSIEAAYSTSNHDAVALSGGGFAVCYQQNANSALQRLAIYDNAGNVVSAAATIQTWTGTASTVINSMTALSSGGVAITFQSSYSTSTGSWYGVWSSTGVQVKAPTQISSYNNNSSTISALTGFFAVMMNSSAGNIAVHVYDNTGTEQGAAFTAATSANIGGSYWKLLSDGTRFWAIYGDSNGSLLQLTKVPTTGTGYVTNSITTTGASNYNLYLDAFYENGYIVGMSMQGASNTPNFLWVVDTSTGALVNTSATLFGANPGTSNSGVYGAIIATGDYSFAAFYEYSNTASLNLTLGKYANTSVIGVSSASALANATVPVQQTAGAYYCNTVPGTTPKLFDNSSTNIYGNKGTFLTNSIVLKGL